MYNGNSLLPYQIEGRNFLIAPNPGSTKNHKYLAWEPGTGKSCIISAALVDCGVETLLLVCPVRIKRTWLKHLINWGVVDSSEDVQILWQTTDVVKAKRVIITSYELLLSPFIQEQLKRRTYDAIVIDEAHRAKTLTSKRSNILFGKDSLVGYARLKWLASGTPMPNGTAAELYPAIATLYPECIGRIDYETFLLRYCGAYTTFNGYGNELHMGTDNSIDVLREQFKGFISFKTIEEVAIDLPPLIEKEVYLNIGQIGADIHDTPISTLARLIGEAKVSQAIEYIDDWLSEHPKEKLIVFAYHRAVLEALYLRYAPSGYPDNGFYAGLIFGGLTDTVKEMQLNLFKTVDDCRMVLLQINAAGEAIDGLQHAANHIINVEPDWSPGVGNQAYGRLYRIGQTKPTYVTTLVAEGTLDETKIYKYDRKQGIIDQYFDQTTQQEEIKTMSSEQGMPTTDQWERIIDIAERIVDIIEWNANGEPKDEAKPKGKGGRKPKNEAAQTQTVIPPTAPSAPDAGNGANAQPQPIETQLPTQFQQVVDVAKVTKARITEQIQKAHNLDANEAETRAIALLSNEVIKPLGYSALNSPEAENATPQAWLVLMQSLAAKQYVPLALVGNTVNGGSVGF